MAAASILTSSTRTHSARAVRLWLWTVAAMVFAMVVVGGATRLTESGLSITEWQPVSGVLPPLSEAQWQEQFDKYKAIPQYQALNAGMNLADFKAIFWWEWTHRLLGRVIGFVFFLPFLWFLVRGEITRELRPRLWLIFGLGAFQGAVGWWMVASGLAERIEVSQYRLAFHLTLAAALYVALVWTAQEQVPRPRTPARLRLGARALLALVLAQIYLGALVAGLRAGRIDNTWPLMEGHFVPPSAQLFFNQPWWRNLFENPVTAQFDHRMLAYLIAAAAIAHVLDVARQGYGAALKGALVLAATVLLQATLGIFTLMAQAPLALALAHQAMAMIVLTAATVHAQALSGARTSEAVRPDARAGAELSAAAQS
jgi:cytochrome c oxidase assembly protein subunit 15